MIDHGTRTAILKLNEKGLSVRKIAKALKTSRDTVRKVIRSGEPKVPPLDRAEKAEPYQDRIIELYAICKGNMMRVHEEIVKEGCEISYQGLTAFCRRHEIGRHSKPPAGRYHFPLGKEMQHDTSPHRLKFGKTPRSVQVASLVFCYSRMMYFQYYPTFNRFDCKVFLTDALRYMGGSCKECMIDNTHVVVLKGTGADMIPVPEMKAFGEQFSFEFTAHEAGDANRSGRVERPFHYIENNFEAGRTGEDWQDWNQQARIWCDTVNSTHKRRLHASPRELHAREYPHLQPLPDWIPDVYVLHQRTVDVEGYIHVHTNHYSVPLAPGRMTEVRETKDRIEVFDGPRLVASHPRVIDRLGKRITDPAHRPDRGQKRVKAVDVEMKRIEVLAPELLDYARMLGKKCRGPAIWSMRRLVSMIRDYPRAPLVAALGEAHHYGLYDLDRVERMVLKRIAGDYFLLPDDAREDDHE